MNKPVDSRKLANFVRKHLDRRLDSEIDDIVQRTLTIAWQNHTQYRGDAQYSTWVHGIALNVCRNVNARFGPRLDVLVQVDEIPDTPDPHTPQSMLEQKSVLSYIESMMQRLPQRQREALMLAVEGLSYDEISKELVIPIGTVRSRINRARSILKEMTHV